jgi:preprotein translocase subunit SecA
LENYKELIQSMKKALPLYAAPSKYLLKEFREMRASDKLEITDVHYLGNEGGISCAIKRGNEVMVISVTHLNFPAGHPLTEEINDYKRNRIQVLKFQNSAVSDKSIGRNEFCTCGSGKKYKRCCGK